MRTRHWPVLMVVAVLAAGTASADPVGRYPYLSPMLGFTTFQGDFKWPATQPLSDNTYLGGRFGYQVGPLWAFELAAGSTPTSDLGNSVNAAFSHLSANLVMTPWTSTMGGPYLFAGLGGGRLSSSETTLGSSAKTHLNQGLLEGGAGLRVWLTDNLGVRVEARAIHWLPKDSKGVSAVNYISLSGGLTLAIGARARDTDGDGVPDSRDKCPNTPAGAKVDKNGCPIDSDGDGVFDGLDLCANTPKGCTVDAKGCPIDTDGDGVCDGVDTCPDTPKGCTVDAKGCPSDADGDGVCDGVDTCPDTPKGCTVDARGCPIDSDGDGVCDALDKCPDTPKGLKVDANGCPIEVQERETELMDTGRIRLQNIEFETGKAALLPGADTTLDAVGYVLSQWPTLRIEIGGHTDDVGGAAANQQLSLARARAVLAYMQQKYAAIDSTRFTVKGYGKSKPLLPNTSDANRAKNRRVEFTVLNKETLQREVEHRRLLKQGESAPPDTTQAPATTPTTPPAPSAPITPAPTTPPAPSAPITPAMPDTTKVAPAAPDTTRGH